MDVFEVLQRLAAHHEEHLEAAVEPGKHPLSIPRHRLQVQEADLLLGVQAMLCVWSADMLM